MGRISYLLLLILPTTAIAAVHGNAEFFSVAEVRDRIYKTLGEIGHLYTYTGQVTTKTESILYVRDSTGNLYTQPPRESHSMLTAGDIVSVTIRKIGRTDHECLDISLVRHGVAPEPIDSSGNDLENWNLIYAFVRMKGVLRSAVADEMDKRYNWVLLSTANGPVTFALQATQHPLAELRSFVDAEIEIRGCIHPSYTWRRNLGQRIMPAGKTPFTVTKSAPRDFREIPPFRERTNLHRQKISGTVMAVSRSCFFLKLADDPFELGEREGLPIRIKTNEGAAMPRAGDSVTVAGFIGLDPLMFQMEGAIVQIEAHSSRPPDPCTATTAIASLFADERHYMDLKNNRRILRVEGRIRESTTGEIQPGAFIIGDGSYSLLVDGSSLDANSTELEPGTLVSATGLCIAEFDNPTSAVASPPLRGFTLIPRTANDIVILQRPPWWTAGRLLVLVAVLIFSIIATSIWNRSLKRLAVRRGRELYKEELAHALAEWKVEERTRLSVELHDSISQTLTGVALQVDAAKGSGLDEKSPAAKFLETARAMLASCRQELRCCIWDLRSRTFEEKDMTEAVRRTLAPHAGDVDILVRFNVPRETLSETSAHDILRIIRELTVNAIRHGHAAHIRIVGELRDGIVRFSVKDDGRGFDPESIPGPRQGHFGLQGIRERVGGHNGTLKVESTPQDGTKVTVSFPADDKENADEQS